MRIICYLRKSLSWELPLFFVISNVTYLFGNVNSVFFSFPVDEANIAEQISVVKLYRLKTRYVKV